MFGLNQIFSKEMELHRLKITRKETSLFLEFAAQTFFKTFPTIVTLGIDHTTLVEHPFDHLTVVEIA